MGSVAAKDKGEKASQGKRLDKVVVEGSYIGI